MARPGSAQSFDLIARFDRERVWTFEPVTAFPLGVAVALGPGHRYAALPKIGKGAGGGVYFL